jgi:hypothetical protein
MAVAHDFGGGDSELEEQSNEGYQEPAFEAFMCPLTRQVMHDPVTIETGQTFEREAILKWFRECRDSGRKPTCPLTQAELRSTDISPSIALRNVIDEWRARNEDKELDKAFASLARAASASAQDDADTLRALLYVSHLCHRSAAKKTLVRRQGVIPTITDLLKSSSRRVRLKALEVLRLIVEDNDENKVRRLHLNQHEWLLLLNPDAASNKHNASFPSLVCIGRAGER